jgi:hypothetical protein
VLIAECCVLSVEGRSPSFSEWIHLVRDEVMNLMCLARATNGGGMHWIGCEEDALGLALDQVGSFSRNMGAFVDLAHFESDLPSVFVRRYISAMLGRALPLGFPPKGQVVPKLEGARAELMAKPVAAVAPEGHACNLEVDLAKASSGSVAALRKESMDASREKAKDTYKKARTVAAELPLTLAARRSSMEEARREAFREALPEALVRTISGQQELDNTEWAKQLQFTEKRHDGSPLSESAMGKLQSEKTALARSSAATMMWVEDMSFRHKGMKTHLVHLAGALTPEHEKQRHVYEAMPLLLRPYEVLHFVPGCGRVLSAVAYDLLRETPTSADSDEDSDARVESEPEVLVPFLPIVELEKHWQNKSWNEITQQYPEEETRATTYILAMYQAPPDDAKLIVGVGNQKQPEMTRNCKGGSVQVLLVEYDDEQNCLDTWTERLDEVWGKYWIDPWNEGSCRAGSPIDKKYKFRKILRAHVTACRSGLHVGDTLKGWHVRPDNQMTNAGGLLRRESTGPIAGVPSMATGQSAMGLGQMSASAAPDPPQPSRGGSQHNQSGKMLHCRYWPVLAMAIAIDMWLPGTASRRM